MSFSFAAANQTDLLAALAAISAAQKPLGAPLATYTITLTANFAITGTVAIDLGTYGSTLTIANGTHVMTGSGGLDITGQGRVILAGNNTFAGGVVLEGGTLELATQGAAGGGTTSVQSASRAETLLVIDGTAMPITPIALGFGGYNNEVSDAYNLADLPDITATSDYGVIDQFGVLSIPTTTGTIRLRYAGGYSMPRGLASMQLIADGHGGTMITTAFLPLAEAVTVIGVGGGIETIHFDDGLRNATVQSAIADPANIGVIAGIVVPFAVNGPIVPAFAAGTIEAFIHSAAAVALPDTTSILVSDAAGVVSVIGGAADNQLVLAGTGGVFFVSGKGQGSVVSGGGNNTVYIQPGNTGQYVDLGAGDDLIVASGGTNLISPGRGHNTVWLGPGAAQIKSEGNDTIIGGAGNAIIDATKGVVPANDMVWLGSGGSSFYGGAGRSTVVSGSGNDFISTTGGAAQIWLGSGTDTVYANGADSVIGGSGSATVAAMAGVMAFGGSGSLHVNFSSNYSASVGTVIGGAGAVTVNGTAMIFGGSGSLVASGYVRSNGSYVAGTDTIVGGSGAATVSGVGLMLAGTGSLLFNATGGYETLVTNPLGSATVNSGLGNYYTGGNYLLLYANGNTLYSDPNAFATYVSYYLPTVRDTIIGQSGALTVNGAAGAFISGSPDGHNVLAIGGGTTAVAGGDGDVITHTGAGAMQYYYPIYSYPYYYYPYVAPAPTNVIMAGGAETVSAVGNSGDMSITGGSGTDLIMTGTGNTTVAVGSGATTIIAGGSLQYYGGNTTQQFNFRAGTGGTTDFVAFDVAFDTVHLFGYGAFEASNALAAAAISGSDEIVSLSDGTRLTFHNVTGLTLNSFV